MMPVASPQTDRAIPDGLRDELLSTDGLLEFVVRVKLSAPGKIDGSAFVCPLPSHEDDATSFRLQGERWTCTCTDTLADIVDLIELTTPARSSMGGELAHELLAEFRSSGYRSISQGVDQQVAAEARLLSLIEPWVAAAKEQIDPYGLDSISELLDLQGLLYRVDPVWILERFSLGIDDEWRVIVPHLDKTGSATGYRSAGNPWFVEDGTVSAGLYGRHLDNGDGPVLVVGDELDTWLASYLLRDSKWIVLGLPTGLHGPHPDWLEPLRGRDVTLALPADTSGRAAARAWADHLLDVCTAVSVAKLDEGTDARSTTLLVDRVNSAAPVTSPNARVRPNKANHRYDQVLAKGDLKPVSDFLFIPTYTVSDQGDPNQVGYVGYFSDDPSRSEVMITTADLLSDASLRKWASRQSGGRTWKGMSNAAASVNEVMRSEAPFLPSIRSASRTGLHEGIFVMEGDTIAPPGYMQRWILTTKAQVVGDARSERLDSAHLARRADEIAIGRLVTALEQINDPNTVTPIVAWLAAAPLRSTIDQFPILSVLGQSGSGKTATVELLLRAWWNAGTVKNIGSGTQFTDFAALGSSNAVPLALDEYRTGDTKRQRDRILEVDEIIRSSYRRSGTLRRGESGRNGTQIREVALHRPLIILGETLFEDLAVRERSVMVTPQKRNRQPDPFAQASRQLAGIEGALGRDYLTWLTQTRAELLGGSVPFVQPRPDRPTHNAEILRAGWQLYVDWNRESLGRKPGIALELSEVRAQWERSDGGNPIWLEGVEAALESETPFPSTSHRIAFRHTGREPNTICVNVPQLVRFMKYRGYDLPGGTKTAEAALKEAFPSGQTNVRRACGCIDCPRSRVFDTGVTELRPSETG